MKASKLVHKILKFINYANVCKFTERDPGVQSAFLIKYKKNLHIIISGNFFFNVPSGVSNLYFSHSNFFIFSPFPGHQMFIFWPVENCITWNLRYLMLRDAGWALCHWCSCLTTLAWLYHIDFLHNVLTLACIIKFIHQMHCNRRKAHTRKYGKRRANMRKTFQNTSMTIRTVVLSWHADIRRVPAWMMAFYRI